MAPLGRFSPDGRRKKRKSLGELQEQRQLPVAIASLLKISLEIHVPFKIHCKGFNVMLVS